MTQLGRHRPNPALSAYRLFLLAPILLIGLACGDDSTAPIDDVPPPEPPPIPAEATAWIESNSVPFDGSRLSLPHDDIQFLRDIVGDARIVSLGENTHGTRDFFEMKARILRFLVEEIGFDAFAIEATWPEANRLDHYVRTGEGDPEVLLSGLYFWTWNTESVLEMIEWMRAHNEAGGDVGFYGFDMQFPGMALHNVIEYFRSADPGQATEAAALVDCLTRHANGPSGLFPDPGYRAQTDAYRTACGTSLDEVRDLLLTNQDAYEAISGEAAFAMAFQSLHVATQYHLTVASDQTRDQFMAENTIWIDERLGPDSRMVLWAHNFHVSKQPGAQGWYLSGKYGDAMVVVGFSHESGWFTAVRQRGSSNLGLGEQALSTPRFTFLRALPRERDRAPFRARFAPPRHQHARQHLAARAALVPCHRLLLRPGRRLSLLVRAAAHRMVRRDDPLRIHAAHDGAARPLPRALLTPAAEHQRGDR